MNDFYIRNISNIDDRIKIEFILTEKNYFFTDHFIKNPVLPAYALVIFVTRMLNETIYKNTNISVSKISRLNFKGFVLPNINYVLILNKKNDNNFSFQLLNGEEKIVQCFSIIVHQAV